MNVLEQISFNKPVENETQVLFAYARLATSSFKEEMSSGYAGPQLVLLRIIFFFFFLFSLWWGHK